jgi:hypothetical protein
MWASYLGRKIKVEKQFDHGTDIKVEFHYFDKTEDSGMQGIEIEF